MSLSMTSSLAASLLAAKRQEDIMAASKLAAMQEDMAASKLAANGMQER